MSRTFFSAQRGKILALLFVACCSTSPIEPAAAQRPEPEAYASFEGDTMFTVLPPNTIPAILEPEFLSGKKANAQMSPDEPVIGIVLGGEAKAYSTWQLDAHEIVNDTIDGRTIAVTW